MIGYDRYKYNCAHHAIRRVNELHGCNIGFSDGDEWQAEFIPKLRRLFKPINLPEQNCLVVMKQRDGGLHLGVYIDWMVEHNFKPNDACGSVIKSDLGTIRSEYLSVRFYAYHPKVSQRS